MKYSQIGQDIFVMSLLGNNRNGTFVDLGCSDPYEINNTILLEEAGWYGVSIDIVDFSDEWSQRKTPFVRADALNCDLITIFDQYNLPRTINYLSIDLEQEGDRFRALKKIFASGYQFQVVTIEHDVYKGYDATERQPQRKFLRSNGYILVCSDVASGNKIPFEDWWINPNFVKPSQYARYSSNSEDYHNIFKKAGVKIANYYC